MEYITRINLALAISRLRPGHRLQESALPLLSTQRAVQWQRVLGTKLLHTRLSEPAVWIWKAPQDSHAEDLVSSEATFRGGASGNWQEHRGSRLRLSASWPPPRPSTVMLCLTQAQKQWIQMATLKPRARDPSLQDDLLKGSVTAMKS